jgi:transcriptional regulator CtsR
MERAKEAVQHFISKKGHHDTTVDETIRPAVTKEQVQPVRHEEVTTAVDREVHQDHYHTAIQPLQQREVLPEKHEHQMVAVEHRSFEHDDQEKTRASLEETAAKFHDTSLT